MNERLSNQSESKLNYIQATIAELLPRYQEAHGNDMRYEILRSMPVEGHEVAWLRYSGTIKYDMTKQGREGQPFEDYGLACACGFAEGIGWQVDEKYGVVGLGGEDKCSAKKAVEHMRKQELRAEYIAMFDDIKEGQEAYGLWKHIPEIVRDLIEKDKRGEFVGEGRNGAHFWGGHFYTQTLSEIIDRPMRDLWQDMHRMMATKQIDLEGCVVQEYREPPVPSWSEYSRYEYEGYVGIAELPDHSKMEQTWRISMLAPNGRLLAEGIEGPRLTYSPDFGVDAEDIANVEGAIHHIIMCYLMDPMSQA